MAEKKPAKKGAKNSTKKGAGKAEFSAEERAAMKEYAKELKEQARGADGERMLLARIASMKDPDRAMAKRIHEIVKTNAPSLSAKTWYGMPAYANKEGKVVCFFQDAAKFKARYATLGFSDTATLDEGNLWPTSFALKKLSAAEEAKIVALLKKAVR